MCSKLSQTVKSEKHVFDNYSKILDKYQLSYQQIPCYYQIGEPNRVQGWVLHLTVTWIQIPELLSAILPLLTSYGIPFKVVQNKKKAIMLCDGSLGYNQLGKVFCIYPPDDETTVALVKEFLVLTKNFHGVEIPTDHPLGGIIYTRYGSFNPKLYVDQNGRVDRYIYDLNGQLIKDEYHTPFKFPKGIYWPFSEISKPEEHVPSTFLNNRYKVLTTIKTDAKGRVMKSLRIHGFWVQWIIIKEAKSGVCVDKKGRDVKDRLLWQYDLLNDLKGKIPVPRVYDFFQEKGSSYLVMEYIKGEQLGTVIDNAYEMSVWFNLSTDKKLLLVDYLLQLADTIHKMHQQGYVHRDINWMNFILNKYNLIVPIDLELAYSTVAYKPDPPFTLGSDGFMSPEQLEVKTPKVNQDIYSLGALMIRFFTNLSPVKFDNANHKLLQDLNFFINNKTISSLISTCLSSEPAIRPDIKTIKDALENFRLSLDVAEGSKISYCESPHEFVEGALNGLGDTLMIHPSQMWHSNSARENEPLENQQGGILYDIGVYTGVSGVMTVLAKSKFQGFEVNAIMKGYNRSWEYIHNDFLSALPNVLPGLYHGAAGVALAISKGIEARLIDAEYTSSIEKCLEIPATALDIAHGVAGQGLAVLNCLNFLSPEKAESILNQCVNQLLENQQKDGSWLTFLPENNSKAIYTGFAQGVAGICYFLLKYYDHSKDEQVKPAVLKALRWLKKKSRRSKEGTFWLISNRGKVFDRWLNNGTAGIALCFITAYKVLGDPDYKEIAENALRINPEHIVYHNFSLANGTTGLAEVYLTASEVFGDNEWRERAEFILNTLLHAHRGNDELCYWIVEDNKMPTADFMVGNSGILHFLIRYLSPQTSFFV